MPAFERRSAALKHRHDASEIDNLPSLVGPAGPAGPAGAAGAAGTTGSSGPSGPAVYLEADGLEGDAGPPGPSGPPGAAGPTGAAGPVGPAVFLEAETGDEGLPGPPGRDGAAGVTGAQGPTGPAIFLEAEAAEDAPHGAPGNPGTPGLTGAQGPTGAAVFLEAEAAEDANHGPPGNPGSQGPPGPQGISVVIDPEAWMIDDHLWTPWLDNASNPNWAGQHVYSGVSSAALLQYPVTFMSTGPGMAFVETDAAANETRWDYSVNGGAFRIRLTNDVGGAIRNALNVTRTGSEVVDIQLGNAISNCTHTFLGTGVATFGGPVTLGTVAGDAASPVNGETWYNSSTKKFRGMEGGTVKDLIGPQSPTVTMMMDDYSTEDVSPYTPNDSKLSAPSFIGNYKTGSFELLTGQFANIVGRLQLVGTERVTLRGTSRLRIG